MFVEQEKRIATEPSTEKLKPWQVVLLKTASIIEERGLPASAADGQGRYCVLFTMTELEGLSFSVHEAVRQLCESGIESIPEWSDKAGREGRGAEVVAKLRAVALGSS